MRPRLLRLPLRDELSLTSPAPRAPAVSRFASPLRARLLDAPASARPPEPEQNTLDMEGQALWVPQSIDKWRAHLEQTMTDPAITTPDRLMDRLGSIDGSMAYLEREAWWSTFRAGRRTSVRLMDDLLWVGHFCRWLQGQHVPIERCTRTELDAYLASIASFRPGPRVACQRTITALVDFLGGREPTPEDGSPSMAADPTSAGI